MPIRVKCESCKKTLSVKDHLAGKKIKCPVCQSVVVVSASSPAPAAKPASAAAVKKPAAVAKPAATKPGPDKTKSNGALPAADKAQSNGTPANPEIIELPPENVEAEALAAFADEPKAEAGPAEPQFIEFKCDWCDEMVKLPIELAGKQSQCPNPECKRIVKVPLPKKAEKKDWKKMDQKGPAAAIINQPEQLADAWGTQQATRARQSSLAEAGAIEQPPKKPRDFVDWLRIAVKYVVMPLVVLTGVGVGGYRLLKSNSEHNHLKEAERLVDRKDPKVKTPLLAAEAHRTIALLNLREGKPYAATKHFQGSLSLIVVQDANDKKNPAVNEQLALIDLAVAQIDLAGDEDAILRKTRLEWEKVRGELAATLQKIQTPEVRVMAMRDIGTRLIAMKQAELAIGLAATLSNSDDPKKKPTLRQQIALQYSTPGQADKVTQKKPDPSKPDFKDKDLQNARVGFAEGCARKGDFDDASKLAQMPGPVKDRLEACLGIAAVAWQVKNKDKAAELCKEAISLARGTKESISPWLQLQLVKLAARTDDAESAKDLAKILPAPFKLRAQLEIFLAVCDKSTGEVPVDALQDLETADKEGTTLALAWLALARQNARNGMGRDRNRGIFEERFANVTLLADVIDKIRPMVDLGTYLGSVK